MKIEELLEQARKTWPQKMSEQEIAVAMGVVYGDICRYVRNRSEGKDVDPDELKKELGNIIFSTIRWCDDLGLRPDECVELAKAAPIEIQIKRLVDYNVIKGEVRTGGRRTGRTYAEAG